MAHCAPQPWNAYYGLFIVDTITVAFFVFDYAVRLLTAPSKIRFVVNIFNIFDLCVIVPYFVQYGIEIGSGTGFVGGGFLLFFLASPRAGGRCAEIGELSVLYVLKLLRVVRVFRLFRLGRYSGLLTSFVAALAKSIDALVLCALIMGYETTTLCLLFPNHSHTSLQRDAGAQLDAPFLC